MREQVDIKVVLYIQKRKNTVRLEDLSWFRIRRSKVTTGSTKGKVDIIGFSLFIRITKPHRTWDTPLVQKSQHQN